MTKLGFLAVGLITLGCKDAAKQDYEACLDFESRGRLEAAMESCTLAVSLDPTSKSGKAAQSKQASLASKINDTIPPLVTGDWCARLSTRLLPTLTSGAKAASPSMNAAWIEQSVREHVQNMEYNCRRDAGKPTAGEWECRWNETFESAKQCDKLRDGK